MEIGKITATLYELGKMKHTNRKSSYDGFNLLVFERENWQYQLSIDRRVADIDTPEVLVEIANSIDYPAERLIE